MDKMINEIKPSQIAGILVSALFLRHAVLAFKLPVYFVLNIVFNSRQFERNVIWIKFFFSDKSNVVIIGN